MAQYWEDWSGSTIGAAPTGWTPRWTSNAAYTVRETADTAAPAGRVLELDTPATHYRALLSCDALDADPSRDTLEVAVKFQSVAIGAIDTLHFGVGGRGSGTTDTNNSAVVGSLWRATSMVLRNSYYSSGSSVTDTSVAASFVDGSWYWLVLSASGTTTTVKLFAADDTSVPLASDSYTNASMPTAAGWVGLISYCRNDVWNVAAVGIGTGGDTAPLSAPATSGAATGTLSATETGADTASIAGAVGVTGALAAAESGADTAAFAGAVAVSGSLAASEAGNDVAALSGTAAGPITGALAASEEGADTAAFSGPIRAQEAATGGWFRLPQQRFRTHEEIDDERRRLGILPPNVAEVVREVAREAVQQPVTKKAEIRRDFKRELAESKAQYRAEYLRALYAEIEFQRLLQQQAEEEEEAVAVLLMALAT